MKGSYRHGTEEGYKRRKCKCVNCVRWFEESKKTPLAELATVEEPELPDTASQSLIESRPPQMDVPDIVSFLHSGKFNEITIDLVRGEWAATIKAHGDKFVGFGHLPDYALYDAVKRYHATMPDTGPITMTYDQSTYETSQGRALDYDNTVEIERIWDAAELETSSESPGETTLEGVIRIGNPPTPRDE